MKIRMILKSFDNLLLKEFFLKIKNQLKNFKICTTISIPTKLKKFCVLKSPHIDKNSREQFELRLYTKLLDMEIVLENEKYEYKILDIEIPKGIFCQYCIKNDN